MNVIKPSKVFFFLPILFALTLSILNSYNTHGDYLFFLETIENFKKHSFQDIFFRNFTPNTEEQIINYSSAEHLFKLLLYIIAKLNLNYNFLQFVFNFFLFNSLVLVLYNKPFSRYTLLLLILSNFYLTTIGLASIKNTIAIFCFFYSFYFYGKKNNFYFLTFYFLALSISIYFVFLYFFLAILKFKDFILFIKKFKILKIVVLLLPIIMNINLLFGKFVGYTNMPKDTLNKIEILKSENKTIDTKKNLYNFTSSSFNENIKGFISYANKNHSIHMFNITLNFVPKHYSTIIDKKIYLNFSIIKILKFILFNFLLLFFLKDFYEKKFFCFFFLISLFFFMLIGFERQSLLFYCMFIILLSFYKKNELQIVNYLLIYIFSFYGFAKTILFLFNLIIFNEIY